MTPLYESDIEEFCIELLQKQGYTYLSPEAQEAERGAFSEVIIKDRLKNAIDTLNPDLPHDAREHALKQVLNLPTQNLIENNEFFHNYITEGVKTEYLKDGHTRGAEVKLIDFVNPRNNDLIVTNQYSVSTEQSHKRPDLVLLVNGLPLVVIELKNPTDENATVKKAFI